MLYEVIREGRSGYIDASGSVIVPVDADGCIEFGDGLGGVFRGKSLEILGPKGLVVGSCSGVYATGPFSEGRLDAIDKADRAKNPQLAAGFLDPDGKWIIPPKFRKVDKFSGGVAVASDSYGGIKRKVGLIDLNGSWIDEPRFESILSFGRNMTVTLARENYGKPGNARCFLIDKKGRMVGKGFFEDGRGGGDGLVPVKQNGKFGCVDESGHLAIPFSFEDVSYFSEGLAAAKAEKAKVGVIDKSGHWVVHPSFVFIGNFSNGVACAQIKEAGIYKWGYIDRDGDWVIKPNFEEAYDFVEGIAHVIPLGVDPDDVEKWCYIKTNGEPIWPLTTKSVHK